LHLAILSIEESRGPEYTGEYRRRYRRGGDDYDGDDDDFEAV
jgi:hypothetical protein